ncbi:MAG: molybdopterin molybdotransferase MoeA [Spirochaetaceae bacterium]|jgi:molybdopterin molybdotransferase|nr:molybdopterin molybdotransferase MoeA [Spirochaetaceae bacterium]
MEHIAFETAAEALLERTAVLNRHETVSLLDAFGRVAWEDVESVIDAPPFDNSPVDGFAVRHEDTETVPAVLRVVERVYAGDAPVRLLGPGECVRIMTGAPIPPGATCVVRYEDTDNGKEYVKIPVSLKKHENYRFQGEDLPKGRPILRRGDRISPAHIGVLAGQGYTDVRVFIRPKVGILSTGSELIPGNQPLKAGKIYDSNRFLLGAKVRALGAEPVLLPSAADEPERIATALRGLLETCDLVVTTGGVSVGDRDYMPLAGRILGAEPVFRGVRMKPGGWITALYAKPALILCLSGNPGAASINFDLLAGPVIRRLSGTADPGYPRVRCVLGEPFPKAVRERRFLYAYLKDGKVTSFFTKFSNCLSKSLGCNCILDIPGGTSPMDLGDAVEVILF